MVATIVNEAADSVPIQLVVPFNRSMLEAENAIQDALNEAETLASANFLLEREARIVTSATPRLAMQLPLQVCRGKCSKCGQGSEAQPQPGSGKSLCTNSCRCCGCSSDGEGRAVELPGATTAR